MGVMVLAQRDARLLEDSTRGTGTVPSLCSSSDIKKLTLRTRTKDGLLTMSVVTIHLDRLQRGAVKATYLQEFGKALGSRVAGETSGS